MLTEKRLLISLLCAFALGALAIAQANQSALDPAATDPWWTLSFADPKGTALDVVLENHTRHAQFSLVVSTPAGTSSPETFTVFPGETKTLPVDTRKTTTGKYQVTVSSEDGTKTIYK